MPRPVVTGKITAEGPGKPKPFDVFTPASQFLPMAGRPDARPLVLVIEDDKTSRDVLVRVLSGAYRVEEAENGQVGLEKAVQIRPHLIISDVMMPVLDGFSVLEAVRNDALLGRTPFLLLTALDDSQSKLRGLKHQADDFLTKPVQVDEILTRARNLVEKYNLQRELEERLRTLDKDLNLARRLQQSLLPRTVPTAAGLRTATLYHPMEAVGGDFFEIRKRGDELIVFVCDVSGHGISAAIISGMVKILLNGILADETNPRGVLQRLHDSLWENVGGQFVTACAAFFHFQNRTLKLASAGHPPVLRLRKEKAESLRLNSGLIGILPDPVFPETEHVLEGGDRFLFYTDGISEAAGTDGEGFGEARLLSFLQETARVGTEAVLPALMAELKSYADEGFRDDIAAVVLDVER